MLKSTLKKLFFELSRQKRYLKPTVNCAAKWYGNSYGGFYVNPSILNQHSIVYSVGIGEDISFDRSIIENHSCHVFGFDPTPKSIDWIKNQKLPPTFAFYAFGLSKESGIVDFYLPKNPSYVSGSAVVQQNVNVTKSVSVIMKSIEDIVQDLEHSQIDLLKIDIEGSEYDIIDSLVSLRTPICQLVIEFHERFFKNGRLKTIEAINKLKKKGFELFAVSDTYEEISFIHKNCL
jgi:FkbM family methyltransferase